MTHGDDFEDLIGATVPTPAAPLSESTRAQVAEIMVRCRAAGTSFKQVSAALSRVTRNPALVEWSKNTREVRKLWEESRTGPPSTLRFLTPADCEAAPSRGYVVKGLIAPRDIACIYGAPGAGKSLIAPHIGYCVALGVRSFALRTRTGPVMYVAPEDPHGLRGRIKALRMRHGDADDFFLVEGVSDLRTPDSPDLQALLEAVADRQPALIFLDTLAASFPGLEENSAEAMSLVVSVARELTEHGAAVVLIHHDTKAQTPTPRGHSLLNGALDVALQLFPKDENGVVRGSLTKNRNGSCDLDIAFRIGLQDRGEDGDGEPIHLPFVDELTGPRPKREKLPRATRAALDVLNELRTMGDVTEEAWRTACIDGRAVSGSDKVDSRRKATDRAIADLASRGSVEFRNGKALLPSDCDVDAFDEVPS